MSGPWGDGPPASDDFGEDAHASGGGGTPHDFFGPPERSGLIRGILLVGLAVLIGALLLPSATRAPLQVLSSRSTTTTTQGSSSTTTVAGGSHGTSPTTTAPAASSIHVLVANATNVNGVAGSLTTFLGGKGFQTLTATNAATTLSVSKIYFSSAGSSSEAGEVASALGLPASIVQSAGSPIPIASTGSADVVVAAGQDLASRFAPTTTTAAHG